jgi:hypothetical protein
VRIVLKPPGENSCRSPNTAKRFLFLLLVVHLESLLCSYSLVLAGDFFKKYFSGGFCFSCVCSIGHTFCHFVYGTTGKVLMLVSTIV